MRLSTVIFCVLVALAISCLLIFLFIETTPEGIHTNNGDSILNVAETIQNQNDSLIAMVKWLHDENKHLDSCLVMCRKQRLEALGLTFKPWIEAGSTSKLRHFSDDYDSVVLIDGLLYERAVGSTTAHNDGVGTPFKGVGER